ncbi:DUF488 domain-containing protein [Mycolicibacterium sp. XJ1819]
MAGRPTLRVARVYDDPEPDHGERVLVDRLWPRGFRKDDARVDRWMPEVAPSTELRRWYSHAPEKFEEFAARYAAELDTEEREATLAELRDLVRSGPVTLVTAVREVDISHATVLADVLSGSPDRAAEER